MSFNLPTFRLSQLYLPAAALLMFAPGCGHNHQESSCSTCNGGVSQSTAYPTYDPQPAYVAPPQFVAPAPAVATYNDPGLRGPRSQSELDSIYRQSLINPMPPPPPRVVVQQPPPPENVVIVAPGESGWSVPITREWKHIVIHHSASTTGSAASFDRAHREKGWDGLGYHFVIGNGSGSGDGQVEIGYRWTKQMQGAHAGNYEYNQHGIGICLVGDFEHGGPPSPSQMASLRSLVAFLQARCNIPPSEIIGHGNVPGRNTECPGRNLNIAAFRASVGSAYIQRSNAPISAPLEKPAKTPLVRVSADLPESKPLAIKAVVTP